MPITQDVKIVTFVSSELAGALKAHAALNDMRLFDLFVRAMDQFIAYRQDLTEKQHSVPYLISPKSAKAYSVRIPAKLVHRLQSIAKDDDVAVRRLLYTALVHFAVNAKLIPAVGTLQSGVIDADSPRLAELVAASKRKRGQG